MSTRTSFDGTSTGVTGTALLSEYDRLLKSLFDGSCLPLTNVAGTDTVTADLDPELDADGLVDGMRFVLQWVATNTGGMTLSINGGTAVDVLDETGSALIAGAVESGDVALLAYMGGDFYILSGVRTGAGGSEPSYEAFTSSGTWTKPSGLADDRRIIFEAWGAGGSGSNNADGGGGGGGAYTSRAFRAADLPSSLTITVGSGGSGNNSSGGNTTVGSILTAYGGGGAGGSSTSGGSGAGSVQAGLNSSQGSGDAASKPGGEVGGGASGPSGDGTEGSADGSPAGTDWGGGGGAGYDATWGQEGGRATFGGGGGAGGTSSGTKPGGESAYGGNGGNRNSPGSAPGGGGGANQPGARGEVRVWIV